MVLKKCSSERWGREKRFYVWRRGERRRTAFWRAAQNTRGASGAKPTTVKRRGSTSEGYPRLPRTLQGGKYQRCRHITTQPWPGLPSPPPSSAPRPRRAYQRLLQSFFVRGGAAAAFPFSSALFALRRPLTSRRLLPPARAAGASISNTIHTLRPLLRAGNA